MVPETTIDSKIRYQPRDPSDDYKLVYDAWNRVVEVKDGFAAVQKNEYDGLNRRIERDETRGDGTKQHFYYNTQWQVLEIEVSRGTGPLAHYVYHPHYVDAVALRYYDEDADGSGVVEQYYLQDANYNVTAVTDDGGTVVERYTYTPYGEATVLDADFSADADGVSDIGNEYLYTGRRLDPETGLQLNRYRFYASLLGRWVNRDPIGYEGSEWNLYEYVGGSPLIYNDPTGEKFGSCFGCLTCSGIAYVTVTTCAVECSPIGDGYWCDRNETWSQCFKKCITDVMAVGGAPITGACVTTCTICFAPALTP